MLGIVFLNNIFYSNFAIKKQRIVGPRDGGTSEVVNMGPQLSLPTRVTHKLDQLFNGPIYRYTAFY